MEGEAQHAMAGNAKQGQQRQPEAEPVEPRPIPAARHIHAGDAGQAALPGVAFLASHGLFDRRQS